MSRPHYNEPRPNDRRCRLEWPRLHYRNSRRPTASWRVKNIPKRNHYRQHACAKETL